MRWLLGMTLSLVIAFTQSAPASAFRIEVLNPGDAHFRITLSDFENVKGLAYFLDRETGGVTFGNGVHGAIPPTGQPGIGSYGYGGGSQGSILGFCTTGGISAVAANATPEPSTILLVATGLIGLVGFRKMFKNNLS